MATATTASTRARDAVLHLHDVVADLGFDIPVDLWDGTRLGDPDRGYRLVLHHPWSLRAMLWPPTDLNVGECYLADTIDVTGSMVAAIRDIAALQAQDASWWTRARLAFDLVRMPSRQRSRSPARDASLDGPVHSRARDREAIRFHYDVGNDFYRLFLDEELVYSCAYFREDDDDLDRAQVRKLDVVCRKLGLRPGMRLLDIGCGWGSLVLHAAQRYGVDAVGITVSDEQAALARDRVARAGLDDRVQIRLEDYRDVRGTFDAVASIGMFEHVGVDRFATYFATVHRLTRPGGRVLNHAITTGRRREIRDMAAERDTFVGRYVFPDGALAPASLHVAGLQDAGFELLDVEQLRPHYARTLRHWVARLEARADEARAMAGEVPYRVWRAYMAGSAEGFRCGDLGLVQVLGGREASVPLGRSWMAPTV